MQQTFESLEFFQDKSSPGGFFSGPWLRLGASHAGGPGFPSLIRELDPACCDEEFTCLNLKKKKRSHMPKLRPGAAKLKKKIFKKEMFSKVTKMWSRAEHGATLIITAAAVP